MYEKEGRCKKERRGALQKVGVETCSEVYHYFAPVHRVLRLRARYPPTNIILKPKFSRKLLFIISLPSCGCCGEGRDVQEIFNRTSFIQRCSLVTSWKLSSRYRKRRSEIGKRVTLQAMENCLMMERHSLSSRTGVLALLNGTSFQGEINTRGGLVEKVFVEKVKD